MSYSDSPVVPVVSSERGVISTGLTIRELLASMAMQSLISKGESPRQTARLAVQHADALLAELEK